MCLPMPEESKLLEIKSRVLYLLKPAWGKQILWIVASAEKNRTQIP